MDREEPCKHNLLNVCVCACVSITTTSPRPLSEVTLSTDTRTGSDRGKGTGCRFVSLPATILESHLLTWNWFLRDVCVLSLTSRGRFTQGRTPGGAHLVTRMWRSPSRDNPSVVDTPSRESVGGLVGVGRQTPRGTRV